jgi:hypothetical protein
MLGIAQQTVSDILAEKRQLALFSKNLPSESPGGLSATSLPKNANWRFSLKTFLRIGMSISSSRSGLAQGKGDNHLAFTQAGVDAGGDRGETGDRPADCRRHPCRKRPFGRFRQKPSFGAEVRKRELCRQAALRQHHESGRVPQIVAEPSRRDPQEGESRSQAATLVGTNRQYVSDAKRIARDSPEVLEMMLGIAQQTVSDILGENGHLADFAKNLPSDWNEHLIQSFRPGAGKERSLRGIYTS